MKRRLTGFCREPIADCRPSRIWPDLPQTCLRHKPPACHSLLFGFWCSASELPAPVRVRHCQKTDKRSAVHGLAIPTCAVRGTAVGDPANPAERATYASDLDAVTACSTKLRGTGYLRSLCRAMEQLWVSGLGERASGTGLYLSAVCSRRAGRGLSAQ